MGRELKRVPMDFDYPLKTVWKGYEPYHSKDKIEYWKDFKGTSICLECDRVYNDCSESKPYCIYHPNNKNIWEYEPPEGEGFQLWETTSEGSPVSPVFSSLETLCEWCADNYTTFAHYTATKEEWMQMLGDGLVYHKEENCTFI